MKRYICDSNKRGLALIFNHHHHNILRKKFCNGCDSDENRLTLILQMYGFEVRSYRDKEKKEIFNILDDVSRDDDLKDKNCLLIVVMTYVNENRLWAKDDNYAINELLEKFFANRCKNLIDKPKLFVIQANNYNLPAFFDGIDQNSVSTIPITADMFVILSTFENEVSYPSYGGWFIQNFCHELETVQKNMEIEIDNLAININGRLNKLFEANTVRSGPMSVIVSSLTKLCDLKRIAA